MRRLFFPIVFLIAATGFFFGGSTAATFFSKPTIIEQQINYSQNSPTSQSENHQPQSESFWVRTLGDPIAFYTFGLFLFTAILAASTIGLLLQTRKLALGAEQQGRDMSNSIAEAARSAGAMETVAGHLQTNAEKIVESVEISKGISEKQKLYSEMQMRAYVSVDIGSASPQNTATGFRFEARPMLINNGMTPARNFCYIVKAGIFPVPLRDDFVTTLEIPPDTAKGLIPPRGTRFMYAVVDYLVPESEVQGIMDGIGQAFYVWGTFSYYDVFGVHRKNEFCHRLTFIPNRDGNGFTVNGLFEGNRNNET